MNIRYPIYEGVYRILTERQIKGKFIQTTPESYTGDITMEAITTD